MGDEPGEVGPAPTGATQLRTFLIADVRGYTTYTREQGDEKAGELAGLFAETTRRVVEAQDGFLLELRGDEALVVFVSARKALRAAVELQAAYREAGLPRGVGIGLDAGEAVPVEGGYRGGALNLAARLCSQAGPGEVLASEAVIHMAAHLDGIAYVDPRMLRLKGYDEPVRAVEILASNLVPRGFSRRFRRARRKVLASRRWQTGIAAVVIAGLAAALLPTLLAGGAGAPPPGVAFLDARDGKLLASLDIEDAAEIVRVGDSFWILTLKPLSFIQVDARTHKIVKRIASPFEDAGAFAIDGNELWVSDFKSPTVVRIDIRFGREVDRIRLSDDKNDTSKTVGIAFGADSVWVGRPDTGEIFRLDRKTGRIQHRIENTYGAWHLAFDGDQLWTSAQGITRIDTATNTIAASAGIEEDVRALAAGGGFAWVTNETKGLVYKIDGRGHIAATYATGEGAGSVSYADGTVWIANHDAGTVTGIDAVSGRRRTLPIGHLLAGVGGGGGEVAVGVLPGKPYEERIAAVPGKVARFLVPAYDLGSRDPAIGQGFLSWQVSFATCATLLNYPDEPAPKGWELQPEIAAAMPALSADRRTYTFTIRPGFKFSPPSNEAVTAETFRFSIERSLSPKLGSETRGPGFLDDVVGLEAFRTGKADHVSGISVDGDRLSITIVRPRTDFLQRLALPYFCPVPLDTPIVTEGVESVASAGPYYMSEFEGGEYFVLKRNPNYKGSRPSAFDAIAFREGIDPSQAVARVEKGSWDATGLYDSLLAPYGAIDKRWGTGSAAAAKGDQRYYYTPLGNVDYLAFNASRAPFSDVKLRRAVAYAINRSTLAPPFDEVPFDRLLPPALPGSTADPVYDVSRSDVAKALALTGGSRRVVRMAIREECDRCMEFARAIRAQLEPVGLDVRIEEVEDPREAAEDGDFDLFNGFAFIDYPSTTDFLLSILEDNMPASWLPREVAAAVEDLKKLSGAPLEIAAGRLAARLTSNEVPVAAFGVIGTRALFSPSLGCRIFPPFGYGVDLAALCPGK
jgi:ABC-type transport system substrate-binding protein/class 3 adenylate cyclase